MVGLIGDRLRRWLDGSSKPTEATPAAPNGKQHMSGKTDAADAGTASKQDRAPTPAGPADAETQAENARLAYEANDED
jgi:hypothetical protein